MLADLFSTGEPSNPLNPIQHPRQMTNVVMQKDNGSEASKLKPLCPSQVVWLALDFVQQAFSLIHTDTSNVILYVNQTSSSRVEAAGVFQSGSTEIWQSLIHNWLLHLPRSSITKLPLYLRCATDCEIAEASNHSWSWMSGRLDVKSFSDSAMLCSWATSWNVRAQSQCRGISPRPCITRPGTVFPR